jgi:sporulation-control protein spo0M
MMMLEVVKRIEAAGMKVLLEADRPGRDGSGMNAYAWSDERGYECSITMPIGIYDHLDDDEVEVLERVIAQRRYAA